MQRIIHQNLAKNPRDLNGVCSPCVLMSNFTHNEPTATQPPAMVSNRDLFLREGYLVLRGVLDSDRDLAPIAATYSKLVDDLVEYALVGEISAAIPDYSTLNFPERFATLVGLTRGSVFDHLDPPLNVYGKGYRRWPNAPSAQPAELFDLISHPRILDAVEQLIGPEICVPPLQHINIKLAASHMQKAQRAERLSCRPGLLHAPGLGPPPFIQAFQMNRTPWHIDEYPGLGDESGHHYINVWVPMTQASPECAPLVVLPRSHLNGFCDFPVERENEAVVLDGQPGDIVLMAGKLFHSSKGNRTENSFRWAFNMRYLPVGYLCGRPYLPCFVARSRKSPEDQLRDPKLWSNYWDAALDYLDRYLYPLTHVLE